METPASELGRMRLCRLDGCPNELSHDDPTRGRYANMCAPCRRGETGPGVTFRRSQGFGNQVVPTASRRAEPPSAAPSLEQLAKAMIPVARELERKATASKAARAATAAAVRDFTAALTDLRDAAQALIQD
jgi:hypothetical protein